MKITYLGIGAYSIRMYRVNGLLYSASSAIDALNKFLVDHFTYDEIYTNNNKALHQTAFLPTGTWANDEERQKYGL